MSGKDISKRTLEDRIDGALSSWPFGERDDAAWEAMATGIEAQLGKAGDAAPEATALLEPPVPPEPPEPSEPSGVLPGPGLQGPASAGKLEPGKLSLELATRMAGQGESKMSQSPPSKRDRSSLKDLAKLASATSLTPNPPPSKAAVISPLATTVRGDKDKKEGDSGVIDLKQMAQQDPEAGERAKSTKLAAAELFADDPAPSAAPSKASAGGPSSSKMASSPPSSKARISSPPAPAGATTSEATSKAPPSSRPAPPSAAEAQAAPASKPEEKKSGSGLWIAGVGGLLAAAAAVVFMLQSSGPAPTAAPAHVSTPVAAPKPRTPPAPTAEAVASADPAPPSENEVDLSTLPAVPASARAAGSKAIAQGPKKSVTVHDPPPATPGPNPELVAKNIPISPMGNGNLNDALRQAAGPTESSGGAASAPKAGADLGSVPQKPSTGAVIGGVSAAMAQARSCLGLDDPISRAAVTFESGGSVTGVVVTGFAAGKPAEACIKAAMKTAKVPPFAQPTYTQTLTVRPNS